MGERPVRSVRTRQYDALTTLLKEVRKEAGLTQEQLAFKLGQHPTYVSKLERGTRRADLIELEEIAIAVGLDLKSFVARYEALLKS